MQIAPLSSYLLTLLAGLVGGFLSKVLADWIRDRRQDELRTKERDRQFDILLSRFANMILRCWQIAVGIEANAKCGPTTKPITEPDQLNWDYDLATKIADSGIFSGNELKIVNTMPRLIEQTNSWTNTNTREELLQTGKIAAMVRNAQSTYFLVANRYIQGNGDISLLETVAHVGRVE